MASPREVVPIDVTFVGHATVLVASPRARFLTDPFLRRSLGPLERHGSLPDPAALGDLDAILISHGHPDHLDGDSLRAVPGSPPIVAPRGLGPTLRRSGTAEVIEVRAGDRLRVGRLEISVVPARHWISPGAPRAAPVGYLVTLDGIATYFAGDTGRFAEMADLENAVDLALLPVWTWGPHLGPGHLGPRTAAEVLAEIGAPAAVPIHWATLYPRSLHRVWDRPLENAGLRFAADAASIAPGADVRPLRPGERTTFEAHGGARDGYPSAR